MTDAVLQNGQHELETARRGSQSGSTGGQFSAPGYAVAEAGAVANEQPLNIANPGSGTPDGLSERPAGANASPCWSGGKTARRGSRIEIKTVDTARRREVNISEWNADVKAFVRDLTGLERMTFADQLDQFLDKKLSVGERLEAALCACVMALVDEEGNALFALDQIETLKQASFSPVSRVLNLLTDVTSEDQSLKKG